MTKSPAQLDAEIAAALEGPAKAPVKHWEKRYARAEQLAVGDVILTGSLVPYTAHEVLQIEPAPRRKIRVYLARLPDREYLWKLDLRPFDTIGVPP